MSPEFSLLAAAVGALAIIVAACLMRFIFPVDPTNDIEHAQRDAVQAVKRAGFACERPVHVEHKFHHKYKNLHYILECETGTYEVSLETEGGYGEVTPQ